MLKKKHHLIIGGAGFIGSQLASKISQISKVTVIDNLSNGKKDYIDKLNVNDLSVKFLKYDVALEEDLEIAFKLANIENDITDVWHLAANSDIPAGANNPKVDLKDTFLTTFGILNSMKKHSLKILHFASSSAIYGDCNNIEVDESYGPLIPISNYGAMKLASEAQISSAFESFLDQVNIFRFPNVVGYPATHGVIFDFVNKLKKNKSVLNVLGNGSQRKPYLHVSDLVNAILYLSEKNYSKYEIYNIGPNDDGISVKEIAELVVKKINNNAEIVYGDGNKGWVGDVSKFRYSTKKLNQIGWFPKLSSREAINLAIDEIIQQINNQ